MTVLNRLPHAAFGAALLALACGAGAQPTTTTQTPQPSQSAPQAGHTAQTGAVRGAQPAGQTAERKDVARVDRRFVVKAAGGGMAEVALGNMARERASNAQVKQFGEKMVQDHTKANQELTMLAGTRGIGTPTESDRKHRRVMDKLGKLQGAEFDRAYMDAMVEDHEDTIELFQEYSEDGEDPQLKAFATKTLPTLRDHLQMARALHEKVQGNR